MPEQQPYDAREAWNALYDPEHDNAIWGADPAPFVVEDAAALWRSDGARRILALPSGDGRNLLPLLPEFPGIVAADASRNALSLVKTRCANAGLPAPEMSVEDVYAPSFPAKSFDSILCWDLLSHLDRPREAASSLLELLADGGTFIANVFAEDDPSLRDDSMIEIGPNVLTNKEGINYWLYNQNTTDKLAYSFAVASAETKKIEWQEPPHPGYREYDHLHLGYVMILRKT